MNEPGSLNQYDNLNPSKLFLIIYLSLLILSMITIEIGSCRVYNYMISSGRVDPGRTSLTCRIFRF